MQVTCPIMLKPIVETSVEDKKSLFDIQFVFRKGRSIVDAMKLVMDIRVAASHGKR